MSQCQTASMLTKHGLRGWPIDHLSIRSARKRRLGEELRGRHQSQRVAQRVRLRSVRRRCCQTAVVARTGSLVPITSKTFDVLIVLLERRDHTVSKDELLNRVWPETSVNENNLARQVSSLRRALGQRPDQHDFLVTVPGQGYRFVAGVQHLIDAGLRHCTRPAISIFCRDADSSVESVSGRNGDEPLSRPPDIRDRPPLPGTRTRRADDGRGGCRLGRWRPQASDSLRQPSRCCCCGPPVRIRNRAGHCSASPLTRRLCRGMPRGPRTVNGSSTQATSPATLKSGSTELEIPTRSG